jgi:hypothetical protein
MDDDADLWLTEDEVESLVAKCRTSDDLFDLLLRVLKPYSNCELEAVCREVAKARLLLQGKGADA